jgi:lipoprotein-anchoring transpeptidase ErfK/SrfK
VALIPIVPIAIGVLIGSTPSAAVTVPRYTPAPPVTTPAAQGTRTPAKTAASSIPGGSGSLVALIVHATTIRSAPGGRALDRLPTRTEFGSPQVLWVVRHTQGWLGVISTLVGNNRVGWIPQSATQLSRVTWELRASLSARQLSALDNGKVVRRFTVAIGAPDAPTPTGRFAVTDRLSTGDPTGPYGCCIIATSAHSPHAIQGWSGGDRIAIHSTPATASIGYPLSHGCLRLTLAEGQWLMNHIPLGTPTLISS